MRISTFLICLLVALPAYGELIDFTNFANYRQLFPGTTAGNPLTGTLDGGSSPWIWYTEPVHDAAPFWPAFDGSISYVDTIISSDGPFDLGDGLIKFDVETETTIEARDELGDVVGTMILKTTEPHPFTTDTNAFRLVVNEDAGMGLARTWSGEGMDPDSVAYFVDSESGVFADDSFLFSGDQFIVHNAMLSFPLVEGLTPIEALESSLLFPETSLLGATGGWVWSGSYELVPEPGYTGWAITVFLVMAAYAVISRTRQSLTS